ncbi:MarR family winged helix-turn-helix transcriptional regulator [Arthrobacter sp. ov118]|uniref:MarR family winged helix-turn-helix transcriptional regulator n=1 Tax=Arthrobacter sp. ov118 TaxID=1761747 RepID=UPI0008E69F85|nr:MarR family transcriptional regulator [Arthrobacter sp. ov118]SFT92500.1 DNA-binding transcriptional regulator, MarR family [Arthrobacter sp. ov118]
MPLDPKANVRDGYLLLTTAARLVQRRHDEALAPLGLTRAAVIALKAVAPRPLNQEQLAAKVRVQAQTLGRVLTRLEAEGLVTRKRNPHDRRQFQVEITGAGEAALTAAHEAESAAVPADFDGWDILRQQLARFVTSLQSPRPGRRVKKASPREGASLQLVGVARREPDQDAPPDRSVEWPRPGDQKGSSQKTS